MEGFVKGLLIAGLVLLIPALFYVQVWVIHWGVNLFTPISMWQAFGISVLLSIVSSALKVRA
jgi:hypothetical protein